MQMNNDEMITIKQFIITFIIVVIIVLGIYFFTKTFVTKEESNTDNDVVDQSYINPEIAIVGTMLNKGTEKYYVIIYDATSDDAASYAKLLSQYVDSEDYIITYRVDLSNPMNSKYVANGSDINLKADDINDLRFGDITVLKIENGKIKNAYDTIDGIEKEWKLS